MTRVFIADDHPLVRRGIKEALRELGGFEIAGEAEHGGEVLRAPDIDRWDVLVLDLSLPRVNGPEVLRQIKARRPDLPVVVLSMYPEEEYAARMRAAGASAYVCKSRPIAELVAAVRAAAAGGRQSPASGTRSRAPDGAGHAPPHAALTRREHQIFMLVVEGHPVADIAAELDVHSCTVSNHLAKIRAKLGAGNLAGLLRYAWSAGLGDAGPRLEGEPGTGADAAIAP